MHVKGRKSQDEYAMCLAVTVSRETPVPVASAFTSWEGMSDYIKIGGDSQELSREEQFESCALMEALACAETLSGIYCQTSESTTWEYHIIGMSWHSCNANMVGKKEFEAGRRLLVGMAWKEGWN